MQNADRHPADQLIQELIARPRTATADEIGQIINRIASAPFDTEMQRVPRALRGLTYQGITLGAEADALTIHLFKRVLADEQWAVGTDATAYLETLRAAVHTPLARLVLYRQWDTRDIAAVITRTGESVDPDRLGAKAEAYLIVLYEANRGILLSGYQFSTMEAIRIPRDALWLRSHRIGQH
jgi:hypothetical protein